MYAGSALARGAPIGVSRATLRPVGLSPSSAGHGRLARVQKRYVTELLFSTAASVVIALMVFLGGTIIGQTETQARSIAPPLWGVGPLQIDPRDGAVASGAVTPYMERANSPDDSGMTPRPRPTCSACPPEE